MTIMIGIDSQKASDAKDGGVSGESLGLTLRSDWLRALQADPSAGFSPETRTNRSGERDLITGSSEMSGV